MQLTKEQISQIIGIVLSAAIALLAVFGYDVGVAQPRLAVLQAQTAPALGAQAVLGQTYEALNVTKAFKSLGTTVLDGGLTLDTNKFVVADTSGNTTIAGTLTVTGAQTLVGNTTASGNLEAAGYVTATTSLYSAGATTLDGGLTMDTSKFVVANTSGNTTIAGTLTVTGAQTLVGNTTASGYVTATNGLAIGTVQFTGGVKYGCASSVSSGGTIAHGIGTTPTAVLLSGYAETITTTPYISALDTTSITVKFLASEADAMTVCWAAGK